MIIPLVCIGIFFLVILFLFARFFFMMFSNDEKSRKKQEKIYKSRFLKKVAQIRAARSESLFPKTYGSETWKSWLKK